MDLTKYSKNGYTGLVNLGNTCFLNSSIQVLSHTYELQEFFNSNKFNKHIKNIIDSELLKEYDELRKVMWSNNGIISPNKFIFNVHKIARAKDRDVFTGFDQNDMPEFLLFMIDCMHNSICRPMDVSISGDPKNDIDNIAIKCYELIKNVYTKEYSEIMDIFFGIYITEISSVKKNNIHRTIPEHYFMLNLPIFSGGCNIYDCLDKFIDYELLEGDNQWFNEKTNKKEDVNKRLIFWSFPKVLIIVLKRFSEDGSKKNSALVNCPIKNLKLTKYVKGYNASKYIYDLFGVCNHMGNLNAGHYTSFVKNINNEWLHYNDDKISKIDEKNIITPMSYCLFYRKKNNLL